MLTSLRVKVLLLREAQKALGAGSLRYLPDKGLG